MIGVIFPALCAAYKRQMELALHSVWHKERDIDGLYSELRELLQMHEKRVVKKRRNGLTTPIIIDTIIIVDKIKKEKCFAKNRNRGRHL